MSIGLGPVVAAALLGLAVLLWPGRASARSPIAGLRTVDVLADGPWPAHGSGRGAGRGVGGDSLDAPSSLWQRDPVDLYRQWRLRRRPGDLVDDVLDLLRGIGPALGAGLTPSRAIELAATSTLGADRVQVARESGRSASRRDLSRRRTRTRDSGRSRDDAGDGRGAGSRGGTASRSGAGSRDGAGSGRGASSRGGVRNADDRSVEQGGGAIGTTAVPRAEIDRLVGALLDSSDRAEPASPVWAAWAERSASEELALVAAAWRLSETTGAPLASAVDRAVRGLLDARSRRGKVAVAVAGPRATVTVLTLLPLTGPVFGLACGIDPVSLYLGSPLATACAVLGLSLVWTGRVWCTRMVRRAVRP
ncbi:hypothetical protein [Terrabacter carboxydivorans]|uniref:Tight adherence protein B n=1 Tax=Terrabacter carboxydivorans TaxID=619730 RepID=A0ABP5Z3N2_9MICO